MKPFTLIWYHAPWAIYCPLREKPRRWGAILFFASGKMISIGTKSERKRKTEKRSSQMKLGIQKD